MVVHSNWPAVVVVVVRLVRLHLGRTSMWTHVTLSTSTDHAATISWMGQFQCGWTLVLDWGGCLSRDFVRSDGVSRVMGPSLLWVAITVWLSAK